LPDGWVLGLSVELTAEQRGEKQQSNKDGASMEESQDEGLSLSLPGV
jgi:hypothetical protein